MLAMMGQQDPASLLSPSWSETALVIAAEQEWISFMFCFISVKEREGERPDLPSGLIPTPRA